LKKRGKLANSIFSRTQLPLLCVLTAQNEFANRGKLVGKLANSMAAFWPALLALRAADDSFQERIELVRGRGTQVAEDRLVLPGNGVGGPAVGSGRIGGQRVDHRAHRLHMPVHKKNIARMAAVTETHI